MKYILQIKRAISLFSSVFILIFSLQYRKHNYRIVSIFPVKILGYVASNKIINFSFLQKFFVLRACITSVYRLPFLSGAYHHMWYSRFQALFSILYDFLLLFSFESGKCGLRPFLSRDEDHSTHIKTSNNTAKQTKVFRRWEIIDTIVCVSL